MEIKVSKKKGVIIMAIEGEIIVDTAMEMQYCFDDLLSKDERNYVIDMSAVEHVDSSGLAAFVRLFKRVRFGKGDVKLCALRHDVLKLFRITRLDKVFDIFNDCSEALASF
ncbi:MAG: STAS domain-containing protein [Chloroflexota bacterium]|nr:STAS domain-containing protein [Chloroflexota bacterium]